MTEKDKKEKIKEILNNSIKNEAEEVNVLRSALSAIYKGPEACSSWLNQFIFGEKTISVIPKNAPTEDFKKLVQNNKTTIFIKASDAPAVIAQFALERYTTLIVKKEEI